MDTSVQDLEARREAILEQMRSIRSMRRGTVNEQHFRTRHKGKRGIVLQGPYYVLSRREGEKTVSKRLRSPAELEQAKEDIVAHKRFMVLCREFEQVTTRLGELERRGPELEEEKKRFKSSWNKTGK